MSTDEVMSDAEIDQWLTTPPKPALRWTGSDLTDAERRAADACGMTPGEYSAWRAVDNGADVQSVVADLEHDEQIRKGQAS